MARPTPSTRRLFACPAETWGRSKNRPRSGRRGTGRGNVPQGADPVALAGDGRSVARQDTASGPVALEVSRLPQESNGSLLPVARPRVGGGRTVSQSGDSETGIVGVSVGTTSHQDVALSVTLLEAPNLP